LDSWCESLKVHSRTLAHSKLPFLGLLSLKSAGDRGSGRGGLFAPPLP